MRAIEFQLILFENRIMHHRESKKEQAMEILKLKKPICPQPEPKDAKSISPTHNKCKHIGIFK